MDKFLIYFFIAMSITGILSFIFHPNKDEEDTNPFS